MGILGGMPMTRIIHRVISQIWMLLVGAGIATRRGLHMAIDIVAARLPLWPARIANLVIAAGCLWFLGLVAYSSLPLLEIGLVRTTPALLIPMWIPYLGLPIGAAYWALETVLAVARRWGDPFGQEPSTAGTEAAL